MSFFTYYLKHYIFQWWIQDFPWGGVDWWGAHAPPTWVLLPKMYAKMKELGPVGGVRRACPPLDLPMSSLYMFTQLKLHHGCVHHQWWIQDFQWGDPLVGAWTSDAGTFW